jgi:hypothetical protein
MFCPSCGTATSSEVKFCRKCGLSLKEVLDFLTSQGLSEEIAETENAIDRKTKRVQLIASTLLIGAGITFVGAIFYAIISEIILAKGEVVAGSIFLAVLSALILGGLLLTYSQAIRKSGKTNNKGSDINPGSTVRLLPDSSIDPISITERTTELLKVNKRR